MADGVAYAQLNLKANIILDMATLTGAQVLLYFWGENEVLLILFLSVQAFIFVEFMLKNGDHSLKYDKPKSLTS